MSAWKWDEERQAWRKQLWFGGKRTTLTCKGTKKDAEDLEARKRMELGATGALMRTSDAPTFSSFCVERYTPYAKANLRGTTWDVRPYQLANLIEFFDKTRLTKITPATIEAFKLHRVRTVSKETVNGELNVLSAVLRYAREGLGLACANPKIKRFKTSKTKKNKIRAYTREEVGFILTAASTLGPDWFALVKFLAETGCRRSEALNLPWARVDLERGLVKIWNDARSNDEDGDYEVKSIEREVTISTGLLVVLKEQKLRVGGSEWVFPVRKNSVNHSKGERYLCWPKNTWLRTLTKANALAQAKRRKETPAKIDGGPHRLRHTFASHFLAAKPDLFALGRVLGHSHSRVTELYSHLLPEHLEATRNVVTFETAGVRSTAPRPRASRRALP